MSTAVAHAALAAAGQHGRMINRVASAGLPRCAERVCAAASAIMIGLFGWLTKLKRSPERLPRKSPIQPSGCERWLGS